MKLLYIASLDFYSKPNPSFHLMKSMIEDIISAGWTVEYIGCEENQIKKHMPDEFENNNNFLYTLIKTPYVKKSSFVRRYLEGIKYSFKVEKVIKQKIKDCDCVFVQSSPTVLYTLFFVKKYAKNKKVIYNVQDMFPGTSIASGVMKRKWMQKIFYKLQKIAYSKADYITVISEDMKKKVIEQGVDQSKIEVIVNWFDDRTVKKVKWEENRFVKKYKMKKDIFYVQYAGTMGYVFDYMNVIKVAEKLKNNKKIIFQMIGEGSQKEEFIKEANKRGLSNIIFLPLESQEMVSDVYSACSVCYIPLKRGIIGNSVPSKIGLLMACKKTIITSADKESSYNSMINDNLIGYAFGDTEIEKIAEAILNLSKNNSLCEKMGKNGYEFGHQLFSRTSNMNKYIELFERNIK